MRCHLAGATGVRPHPIRPIQRMCALPGRLSPGGVVRVTTSPPSPGFRRPNNVRQDGKSQLHRSHRFREFKPCFHEWNECANVDRQVI